MKWDNGLALAFKNAETLARTHYENFPVISLMVPKQKRKYVAVIYKFARTADDFADEGNLLPEERERKLDDWGRSLSDCLEGNFKDDFWKAVYYTLAENKIDAQHLFNLLKAFKQDVSKKHYSDFNDLLNYCTNSANPVGRIILQLHSVQQQNAFNYSDDVCSALQLANFWQDVSVDILKNRIYIPTCDMESFGVSEKDLTEKIWSDNFRDLIKFQVDRTQEMFDSGKQLLNFLNGKLFYQIKWTIKGGEKILEKIRKQDYNVLMLRPKLSKADYFILLIKSLLERK